MLQTQAAEAKAECPTVPLTRVGRCCFRGSVRDKKRSRVFRQAAQTEAMFHSPFVSPGSSVTSLCWEHQINNSPSPAAWQLLGWELSLLGDDRAEGAGLPFDRAMEASRRKPPAADGSELGAGRGGSPWKYGTSVFVFCLSFFPFVAFLLFSLCFPFFPLLSSLRMSFLNKTGEDISCLDAVHDHFETGC